MNNKKLRIYLNIFLFIFLAILLFLYIAPFGRVSYKKNFSQKYNNLFLGRGNIYKLGPNDRVFDKNKLSGEPGYFYLKTSRNFDLAKVKIKYKISDQIFKKEKFINIEAGVLLNKDNWNYRLYPVYNNILNDLYYNWDEQSDGRIVFLQKNKKFSSLDDYLQNNDFSSLLLYNYNLDNDFVLKDYQRLDNYKVEIPALRGSHVFYTYLKNENLKFDFSFKNLNKESNKNLDLFVYLGKDIVFSKSFLAEEFSDNKVVNFNLDLPDLPESVYKIEIRADDNFIINKIDSYLPKLVFLHKLNLYNTKSGFDIFANKSNFRIKSLEAECLGDISINKENFSIDKIFQQFNLSVSDQEINNIKSSSCGMLVENNGLFSFSVNSFFNPLLSLLSADTSVNNYDYVIADYNLPIKIDNYYTSELLVDLNGALRERGEYRFIISAPFLKNEDRFEYLEIESIEINLFGENLKDKLKKYLILIYDVFSKKN